MQFRLRLQPKVKRAGLGSRGECFLDKSISIRFYRVTGAGHHDVPFLQRLAQINAIPRGQRVHQISDLDFWMDQIVINGTTATGMLGRRQSNHLPPRAMPDGSLLPLGIPSIGHTAIWQYESNISVMAIEVMRNGVGMQKLFSYIRGMCDCRGYTSLPVLDDTALDAAENGRIRELAVRMATPRNLETVAADQRNVKSGMIELMGSRISTQIEVKFSVSAGAPDIQPSRFRGIVDWIRGEREADRGSISKLQARVVDDDGTVNVLDLLDSHLGTRQDLDLPDDDPVRSSAIRLNNIAHVFNAHRSVLQKQFGP
jgi:hypothetical protein